MSSFRKPYPVIRRSPGHRGPGNVWVEGEDLPPFDIMASIQPATSSDYDTLQATEGGRRTEAVIRLYSDTELISAGRDSTNGDRVLWRGNQYMVIAVSPWQSNVIPHFRMLAVKVLES